LHFVMVRLGRISVHRGSQSANVNVWMDGGT
jgi:hypothetical protein